MRPIPSPISREVFDLMNKAQSMVERIDVLAKAKKCKDCGDGKCNCKDCPECGGKMNKMGCKMGCGGNKMAKQVGDGGTFTIGDAQKRNSGVDSDSPKPREPDYSEAEGEDYERTFREFDEAEANEKPMSMREDDTPARTLPLSEGKTRDQKRGDASRGVQVKKPGFRSNEQMPMSDAAASGKPEEVVDAMMARREKEKEGGGGHKGSIFRHPMVKSESGAQPGFNTSFDTKPQDISFVSESGGQTRNAYYTTNQHLLDSDDVANKGATSVTVSLEKLASMLNPHEGGGASRLDDGGVLKNNPN